MANSQENRVYEVTIACKDLIALDQGSPSDPCCFVRISDDGKTVLPVGRTEEVMDNANAEFVEKFVIPYVEGRRLVLNLYDIDSTSSDTSEQDLIGTALIKLRSVVEASEKNNAFYEYKLFFKGKNEGRGSLRLFAEEYNGCKAVYTLKLTANNFPDKYARPIRRKKVFYEIHKTINHSSSVNNNNKVLVYRSEVVEIHHDNKEAEWKSFTVNSHTFCSNDDSKTLFITVFRQGKKGNHKAIGCFETTLSGLSAGSGSVKFSSEKCQLKLSSIICQPSEAFPEHIEKYEDARRNNVASGGIHLGEKFNEHTGRGESASKVLATLGAITTGTALAAIDGLSHYSDDN